MDVTTQNTRRYEIAMEHFKGLNLGATMASFEAVENGDKEGFARFFSAISDAGKLRTIRKLSAIWQATDEDLKASEANPGILANLEEKAAERLIGETLRDAVVFQHALWKSFGLTLASFGSPAEAQEIITKEEGSPSEGSPSEG